MSRSKAEGQALAVAMYGAGSTELEISAQMNVSAGYVRDLLRAAGIELPKPPPPVSVWTHRDAELKELWSRGWAASRIAEHFGDVSRNAVIGRLHRIGCRREISGTVASATTQRAQRAKRAAEKALRPKAPKRVGASDYVKLHSGGISARARSARGRILEPQAPAGELFDVPLVDVTNARPWLQRERGQCAWPIAGRGADTISCCAPVHKHGSWCKPHRAIGYRPVRLEPASYVKSMRRYG